MKKVVWLCSIYPSSKNPFLGDFIERHAIAASLINDVSVVHVCSNDVDPASHRKIYSPVLRADIINIQFSGSVGYAMRQIRFVSAYMKWMSDYIKINGKPRLVHVHNSVHGAFIAWLIKMKYGIPYLVTEHSSMFLPASTLWMNTSVVVRQTVKLGVGGARGLSCVSQTLADNMQQLVTTRSVRIIPNVVDTSLFYFDSKFARAAEFIHNTGPERIKNTLPILRAITAGKQQLAEKAFRLLVFGEFRADLEEAIALMEIGHLVVQKGEVPQSVLAAQIRQAAGIVQYSSYETFGCIVAESLSAGCPVIASDIPAMRELITTTNGILCKSESELAEALLMMTEHPHNYPRLEISLKNAEKFSYPLVASKFNDWYESVGD